MAISKWQFHMAISKGFDIGFRGGHGQPSREINKYKYPHQEPLLIAICYLLLNAVPPAHMPSDAFFGGGARRRRGAVAADLQEAGVPNHGENSPCGARGIAGAHLGDPPLATVSLNGGGVAAKAEEYRRPCCW